MDLKEDLEILDVKLTRLKVEYEHYFMHILKREPLRLRDDVDRLIRRWSGLPITNTALKFKYHSLVARCNTFKYYWSRTLRAIEEGTYERRAEGGAMAKVASVEALREKSKKAPPEAPAQKGEAALKEVFQSYIEARKKCNQPTKGLTLEKVKTGIEGQKKKLESKYGTNELDVKVYIKDGTAKLTVVPRKK